ncbi:PREDICTED: G-protein coupled receptor Mth2-like [Trachymyrmex cornetzi]|uniref:G-protein coupled receptor Mth2-like n=1 Tax=Trachymyrmex cornetzi TaxID=471704 RepID=UPI00084F5FE3|nr:PREDICTED: G-protein coupled receptor Mth2-like [Trachymyrmex cornetzi]
MCLSSILLCFAFLLVASFSEPQDDFTNGNEQSDNSTVQTDPLVNSTKYRNEEIRLTRFNSQKNSIKNNDKMQHESCINSTNNNCKNDSVRYESRDHIIKNVEDNNQTSMKFYANSTEINDFTLQEINKNLTKTEDKNDSIPYKLNSNRTIETTLVEYRACNNSITCIQFCCPFGNIVVEGRCISRGEDNYALPNIYALLNLNEHENDYEDETVDELVFTVHDPCIAKGHIHKFLYPNTYFFLTNGDLFTYSDYVILPKDYCFAILSGDIYSVIICESVYDDDDRDDSTITPSVFSSVTINILLSLLFLLLTFIIYSILPIFQTIHNYTMRTHVGSLFIAYAIMCFGQFFKLNELKYCVALAYIFYFFFLSSFFWLNAICFDIWWTFRELWPRTIKIKDKKKHIIYSIYAWGVTIFLIVICVIMDNIPLPENLVRPEMCEKRFWFGEMEAQTLYFYVPMGATIISNIFFFVSSTLMILCLKIRIANRLEASDITRRDENKQRFNMYLLLFLVMGIAWISELMSLIDFHGFIWYLQFATISDMQGFFIFIIFVCRKRILKMLLKRFKSKICGTRSTRSLGGPETIPMQQINSSN